MHVDFDADTSKMVIRLILMSIARFLRYPARVEATEFG